MKSLLNLFYNEQFFKSPKKYKQIAAFNLSKIEITLEIGSVFRRLLIEFPHCAMLILKFSQFN